MATKQAAKESAPAKSTGDRAFRGLFLVFLLTFLNLAGMFLTAVGLNALGDWTAWQFVGLFGVLEAASGLSNIVTPNLWAMPVVEQETSQRTRTVLAFRTLTLAHWGGLARTLAGLIMIGLVAWQVGVSWQTLLLLPLCLLIAWLQIALSAVLARAGVAFYQYDVLQITLNWYKELPLPPISLSASALQFVLSLITIPAISFLKPGALYLPELAPSIEFLGVTTVVTVMATVVAFITWFPRIAINAPREQQEEAEARA